MGIIKPPWISKEWFKQCPFNYCDHFGDKQRLAEVCKICKDELAYEARCKTEGKDPYDMKNVFKEIGDNFAKVMAMIQEEAKRMGIDLKNIDEDYEKPPKPNKYPIYKLVTKYGDRVENVINELSEIPIDADMELAIKARGCFSHSRHYVIVKIARALSSRWEEKKDPQDETEDSKTSALLAYIATERNARAALAMARHKPMRDLKSKFLKFAKLSLEIAEMINRQFFPKYKLAYKEFGTEEYDQYFELATQANLQR